MIHGAPGFVTFRRQDVAPQVIPGFGPVAALPGGFADPVDRMAREAVHRVAAHHPRKSRIGVCDLPRGSENRDRLAQPVERRLRAEDRVGRVQESRQRPAGLRRACAGGALRRGQRLDPLASFYMATRGNAEALGLADTIGSIAPGRAADLIVLDAGATPTMRMRHATMTTLAEELFLLQTMGDDRSIAEVYVAGARAKSTLVGL